DPPVAPSVRRAGKPLTDTARVLELISDAMREAQVASVVVRSISGHLTERMQQRYSTAQGHEQEQAIARIVDLTRIQRHMTKGDRSPMHSKADSARGQHEKTG